MFLISNVMPPTLQLQQKTHLHRVHSLTSQMSTENSIFISQSTLSHIVSTEYNFQINPNR